MELGDVCEAVRGVTYVGGEARRLPDAGYVGCVTTSAVQNVIDWNSRRYIPAKAVKNKNRLLQSGDILVSTANSKALVGKSCLVNAVPEACTFGAFVTVLRPGKDIVSSWLSSTIQNGDARQYFYDVSSNTTNISNLKVSDLLSYPIPMPPLAKQQRIVAELESQTGATDRAKQAAEEALTSLRELPGALQRRAFAGEVN